MLLLKYEKNDLSLCIVLLLDMAASGSNYALEGSRPNLNNFWTSENKAVLERMGK